MLALRRAHQPVIGAVRGACAGFGLSLMLGCDLALAADNAYFATAYAHDRPVAGRRRHLVPAAHRRAAQGRRTAPPFRARRRPAGPGTGPDQPRRSCWRISTPRRRGWPSACRPGRATPTAR
ncbi:MAG: enoyl-CoA hydratase-related protein [Comamonadaceae bacterium]|nr:enoyl-CoA hydratase-related protein [Comamonadaceae bacterium]